MAIGLATTEARRRSRRLELRTTPDERDLIDRAVAVTDTGLTEFVVANAVEAARRVLADSESDEARAFYVHLVPEFEVSPTDGLHLVLLMKDIRRTLRA